MTDMRGHTLAVIYWRDIPSQVIFARGRDRKSVVLPSRFQLAIDQAAMSAGSTDSGEYLDGRRKQIIGGEADPERTATELRERYSSRRPKELVTNEGFDPA